MSAIDELHSSKSIAVAAPTIAAPGDSGIDGPEQPQRARTTVVDRLASSRATALLWRDWRVGAGAAAGAAAVAGMLVGWWTPRGPMTTTQALAAMAIGAVVGVAAGVAARSRWAMMVAPVVFAAVFEVARIGSDGPTVDAIHPGSTYGFFAFVVGRGFHGLLVLVPMLLGAAFGAAFARRASGNPGCRQGRARVGLYVRRTLAGAGSIGIIALAVGIARPASTASIRDANGNTIDGSIAELSRVEIGGHDLAMMIRGASTENPILLYLAGGPGGSELGAMRNHLSSLEQDFVVVTWDQRGTGKSYTEIEPTATLTFDNAVADTIEVTNYLRDRFGQDKIFLLGQSYGTFLGVRAVQQHPELYTAFIGAGQMVSARETDRIFYADTLAWARDAGNDDLVDTLTRLGPPPYRTLLDLEATLANEHEVYPYDHSRNSEGEGGFTENFFVPEYTLVEQIHLLGGFLDTFNFIYPQIQDIDFRLDATRLDVPVFFVQGAHEADGRAEPFAEWYSMLSAPTKDLVVLDTSGHRPLFEQPDDFVTYMTDTVLAEMTPTSATR
jgi:pimeloyl-ACP methyl ester carboxylesterase